MLYALPFLLLLQNSPSLSPEALLTEYIQLSSSQPQRDARIAADFWTREANKRDIASTTFTLDPNEECVHFMARIPATISGSQGPLLLIHHSDLVSAVEADWKHPPYEGRLVDQEIWGRGALDDKGPGVIHWQAFLGLLDLPLRTRDVYFVVNCGEETGNPYGAKAFVHYLIKSTSPDEWELRTVDKVQIEKIRNNWPSLRNAEWAWNEGSFIITDLLPGRALAPVSLAQKGYWKGRIAIKGSSAHTGLSSNESPTQALVKGLDRLYDMNRGWKQKFHALHYEMASFVEEIASTQPLWKRFILWIYPRAFFELMNLPHLVSNWWAARLDPSNSSEVNVVSPEASAIIEYRFLGEKLREEIETDLERLFKRGASSGLQISLTGLDYSPFRRNDWEGADTKALGRILQSSSPSLVAPFIAPVITDSRFYRMAGLRVLDFTPLELTKDHLTGIHGTDERIPVKGLQKAIQIESQVLRELLQ